MSKSLVFIFSFLCLTNMVFCQNIEIGLTLGTTTNFGDIHVTAKNIGTDIRPAIGVLGKLRVTPEVSVRAQVLTGKMAASEKQIFPDRGFSFQSRFTEIAGLLEWEILNRNQFAIFVFGGVGTTLFDPKTDYNMPNKFWTDKNPDLVDYKKTTLNLPIGLGLKYSLPNNFYLSAEAGYRVLFTDYLDGISNTGNSKVNDMYYYTGITLTKAFGDAKSNANRLYKMGASNCPKF